MTCRHRDDDPSCTSYQDNLRRAEELLAKEAARRGDYQRSGSTSNGRANSMLTPCEDPVVNTTASLRDALARVTFRPSCVNMAWGWEVQEVNTAHDDQGDTDFAGWLVNTTFKRPDTDTGAVGRGAGRQEFIPVGSTVSGVVKTCWLLAELIVRHELMEAFCFDGRRVFDPHKTVAQMTAENDRD